MASQSEEATPPSASTAAARTPEVTEVHPNQPAFRYGCECHDKVCTGSTCVCNAAGVGCNKDCFCSDYDPNVADLKYLEMDADDESDDEDEETYKPKCGNRFDGLDELCEMLEVEPTRCFLNYISKRTRSVADDFTKITGGDRPGEPKQGAGHSKVILWLFRKMMGLPVPSESAHLSDDILPATLTAIPQDPIFESSPALREWKKNWIDSRPLPALQYLLMGRLIQIGAHVDHSDEKFYCFCLGKWEASKNVRHCWGCHGCRGTNSWHCGRCNKCVSNFKLRCIGCGGVSEDFGKATREIGFQRDYHERIEIALRREWHQLY